MIATSLTAHLQARDVEVLRTSRRARAAALRLDLSDPPHQWPEFPMVDAAFICAARTSIRECESDPAGTARVNVDAAAALSERLSGHTGITVFLSTNMVFDGGQAVVGPDSPARPRTEYGRQKAAAERAVLAREGGAVLRLSKVIGPIPALFENWVRDLRGGRNISPFSDMNFAPVTLAGAVQVIAGVAAQRMTGVSQYSASRDISYRDAALRLATHLDADSALVGAASARQAGLLPQFVPKHTTLDCSRIGSALGKDAPDPIAVLDEVFESWPLH